MGRRVAGQIGSFKERRLALQRASELLATQADHCEYVHSYARMNPLATHEFNSFYFGKPDYFARAVIFGPWLYLHAPRVKLPKSVSLISEEERRRKHLGNLTAKVLLTDEDALDVVGEVIQVIKRGPKNADQVSHVERVRPPQSEKEASNEG